MPNFTISIVSDTVCPWCYIGLRNLQTAITQRASQHLEDTFSISWHPFQLNPNAPRGRSVDKQSSYENKLGPDGARAVFHRISSAGERAGIKFSFGGRTGNTLDSHRLLEYAARQDDKAEANDHKSTGLQTRLAEELFADYFEREQDITSHTVLRRAAVRAGIASSEGDIERFLASNDLVDEVQKAAAAQREEGVSGIPYFVINDEFAVEGAQEPIAFLHLFERLVKRGRMGPSL